MQPQKCVVSDGNRYVRETDLVRDFLDSLLGGGTPWGGVETTTEWDYRTGITDVLARTKDGDLIAFEAKLTDWRRAAHQAYRNTTFARRAYVVMPQKAAEQAGAHVDFFLQYGVGLCSVQRNSVTIIIEAPASDGEPLLPWMHKRAHQFFDKAEGNVRVAS